jgi:hypothetical protein
MRFVRNKHSILPAWVPLISSIEFSNQVQELSWKPVPEVYRQEALSIITCYRPLHHWRTAERLLMGATSSMLLSGDFLEADGEESLPMGVSVVVNSVFWRHAASAASSQCLSTQKDKIQNVLGFWRGMSLGNESPFLYFFIFILLFPFLLFFLFIFFFRPVCDLLFSSLFLFNNILFSRIPSNVKQCHPRAFTSFARLTLFLTLCVCYGTKKLNSVAWVRKRTIQTNWASAACLRS